MQIDPILSSLFTIGELRCLRLANEDHPAVEQTLDCWGSSVLGREEIVEGTVAASGVQAFNVVDVLDSQTQPGERFLCSWGKVESRWNCDALGGGPVTVCVELLETTFVVGDDTVDEGLLLVAI